MNAMNLLQAITSAQGGGAVNQLAGNFGISGGQAQSAISALLPALSSGLKRNVAQPQGLEGLMGALSKGSHDRYLEEPSMLGQAQSVSDGNGILGHLLGSKEVSRGVARKAAQQTGLGEGMLKKMLPLVATMAMGALSKQTASAGLQAGGANAGAGGLLGMLTPMLDSDGDGSVADDLLGGIAGKLF